MTTSKLKCNNVYHPNRTKNWPEVRVQSSAETLIFREAGSAPASTTEHITFFTRLTVPTARPRNYGANSKKALYPKPLKASLACSRRRSLNARQRSHDGGVIRVVALCAPRPRLASTHQRCINGLRLSAFIAISGQPCLHGASPGNLQAYHTRYFLSEARGHGADAVAVAAPAPRNQTSQLQLERGSLYFSARYSRKNGHTTALHLSKLPAAIHHVAKGRHHR